MENQWDELIVECELAAASEQPSQQDPRESIMNPCVASIRINLENSLVFRFSYWRVPFRWLDFFHAE